jgi:UDP-glucuronate 4-epimerase
MSKNTIMVTGCAGFIGFHVAKKLMESGFSVVGVDNINAYYEISLKHDRLSILRNMQGFSFFQGSIEDVAFMSSVFETHPIFKIVHLAAQAGVRYSIENPQAYIDSNVSGTGIVFEMARLHNIKHVIYASSSSVYGNSQSDILSLDDRSDTPVSMYAATKRMNEMMANVYHNLYGTVFTGLRFFTVYGPWGRPDMAPIKFAKAILAGEKLPLFNGGDHYRDFTYIDDIVNGVVGFTSSEASLLTSPVYNIGAGSPVYLMDFVNCLEEALGKKASVDILPMQEGDVYSTHADLTLTCEDINYKPTINVEQGVGLFVDWYRAYYSE